MEYIEAGVELQIVQTTASGWRKKKFGARWDLFAAKRDGKHY